MNYRVLVIDDDCEEHVFITEAFRELFEKIKVIALEGGERALKYIEECDKALIPDFVLLDINMPKLNGFSVLQQLKSNLSTQQIPVYMLSTSDNLEDIQKATELGAAGYYCKPSSFDGYRNVVSHILNAQHFLNQSAG